ncbi:protein translocase subunit SecF [soil metagenome]|jgi:preprotein translocase subunit SecF
MSHPMSGAEAGPATTTASDSRLRRLLTGGAGKTGFDFIGRSGLWLRVVIATVLVCLAALAVRQLNFGIDFTGGTSFTVTGAQADFTADDIRDVLGGLGITESFVQVVAGGEGALVSTAALEEVEGVEDSEVAAALRTVTGAPSDGVDVSTVGPRWGAQVTREALRALVVFLALVLAYISFRFEWRMAVAAVVTLLHDVFVTVGIYALVGFEVTPASVIAFLTILGYSLYDTVVVFDRVIEDTAGLTSVSTTTYGESANRALNAVLIRSLSTSITSILPVGSLLFIGARLLGAATLEDLALALFIGMAVGTYSSIVVATPLLVWLKEKEPRFAELKERVLSRRRAPAAAVAPTASTGTASTGTAADAPGIAANRPKAGGSGQRRPSSAKKRKSGSRKR